MAKKYHGIVDTQQHIRCQKNPKKPNLLSLLTNFCKPCRKDPRGHLLGASKHLVHRSHWENSANWEAPQPSILAAAHGLEHWSHTSVPAGSLQMLPSGHCFAKLACHCLPNNSQECLTFFKQCHEIQGCTCHKH